MKLSKGELRVFYKHGDKVFEELDKTLEDTLGYYGFEICGSGYNSTTGIRELAFCLEDKEKIK